MCASPAFIVGAVLAIAAGCALLLALPGQTVTTKYVNDLFVFLDGAHRVLLGQVPNRDFHSALGPLAYYIPAAGLWISGSYGGAMPTGMALAVLVLALPAAQILRSRLRPPIAVPLAAFLLLVAAVPINLGESVRALSFAMFYNRVGWAALGFLLVMYVRPDRTGARQDLLDTVSAAGLVLILLYLKISYGLVGLAFLIFLLLDWRQRRWAAAALALIVAIGFLIEAVWRSSASHFADLLLAGRVSGALGGVEDFGEVLLRNLAGYVLFALVAILALWRTRRIRDALFYGFCAGSGLMLIKQNFQNLDVVTLGAGAGVAAELAARTVSPRTAAFPAPAPISAGMPVLLLALLLPSTIHNAAALCIHAALATVGEGAAVPLPNFDRIRLAKLWGGEEYPAFKQYLASLRDGAAALESLDPKPSRVLVLDFVGPFSAGLGLEPPSGDSTWHHWERTVNEQNFLPADELLRDVQVVMEPKRAIEVGTAQGLRQIYAGYLAEHFELARETEFWRVYVVKSASSREPMRSVNTG